MNFITYINQFGSFKTAFVNYDPVAATIETQNAINEDYLVTSVFVEGVKRLVDIKNAVQLSVINDNNFDGSLVAEQHYNLSGTYFTAVLLSFGAGSSTVMQTNEYLYFDSFLKSQMSRYTFKIIPFSECILSDVSLNPSYDLVFYYIKNYRSDVMYLYNDIESRCHSDNWIICRGMRLFDPLSKPSWYVSGYMAVLDTSSPPGLYQT